MKVIVWLYVLCIHVGVRAEFGELQFLTNFPRIFQTDDDHDDDDGRTGHINAQVVCQSVSLICTIPKG